MKEFSFKVVPAKYKRGYCPTLCRDYESAQKNKTQLEKITGFAWVIRVN